MLKKTIIFSNKNNDICFRLKSEIAIVMLEDIEIIFEDRDSIFFRPKDYSVFFDHNNCPLKY